MCKYIIYIQCVTQQNKSNTLIQYYKLRQNSTVEFCVEKNEQQQQQRRKKKHVDIMCSSLIMYLTLLSIAVCVCLHFFATRFNAYMHQLGNYVSAFAV